MRSETYYATFPCDMPDESPQYSESKKILISTNYLLLMIIYIYFNTKYLLPSPKVTSNTKLESSIENQAAALEKRNQLKFKLF